MSNIKVLDDIVSEVMEMRDGLVQLMMKANHRCPECQGTNLNEDRTLCWDCSANDYRSEVSE